MHQGDTKRREYPIVEKEIALSHSFISKRYDGIIEIYYTDITYDVEHFLEIDNYLKSFYENNKKLLVLNITCYHTSVTSKARSYLAQPMRAEFIKAYAIIIHSLAQKILVHFYLHINKPKVITNYFIEKDKSLAEHWLLNFGSDQNHF